MAEGVGRVEPRIVRALALVLLTGAGVRLLAAVVAGFVEWHDENPPFPTGRARAFDVLTTFGAGGDGAAIVLAMLATLAVWAVVRGDDPLAGTLQTATGWVLGVTALLACLEATGVGLVFSLGPSAQTSRIVITGGFALAALVLAIGGIVLTRQLAVSLEEQVATDDVDAFVFAVDRHTGDVRAFLSVREAARRMHIYSIEEDEFAFYTDEGVVLDASVEDDRIVLRPTDQQEAAELLERLKDFANRRGISVDADDVDDPTAYAVPISRWHWLEMWPPWMRPIGMLFRRTG